MNRMMFSEMNRREFMKRNALGIALMPALSRSVFAQGTASQRTQVALVVTKDRREGVTVVLNTLDHPSAKGRRVLIKPNFNTADPTPGGTHNDTLSQLIIEMRNRGGEDITIGESSGPPVTRDVMEQKGTFQLAKELNANVNNFEELADDQWVHFDPPGSNWSEGFSIPREVAEAEYLVSTPCLKTHSQGVFTLSLKIAVGLTPKTIRGEMHGMPAGMMIGGPRPGGGSPPGGGGPPAGGAMPGGGGPPAGAAMDGPPPDFLAKMDNSDLQKRVAEINYGYRPHLIVMDGIDVFTDGGPSRGTLKQGNVFIGGTDRIAVDAVGVAILKELGSNDAIMGTKIFDQVQIARAVELGLGIGSPGQIEFVTPDRQSAEYADRIGEILAQG